VQVEAAAAPAVRTRLISLDAFRGLTMAGMVIVNNPGTWSAMYWPLEHAGWNGWTPTDLIFPFFLFIVGVSMTLSRQTLGAPWGRILRRAAVIVGLGLFMAGFPFFNPSHWRIPGVLQRIGLCYLAAASLYRLTRGRRQIVTLVGIILALLIGYWIALGIGGDLTPEGNLGARIDRGLLGGHLWRRDWDPEGLLSTLPAVATTLVGVLAGMWTRSDAPPARKVVALAAAGFALFAAGEAWGLVFPINKQLWTSSYVLLTGGAAAVLLAGCIHFIEVRKVAAWSRPFVVLGSNAIALFVVSGLVARLLNIIHVPFAGERVSGQYAIYERLFAPLAAPKNASLIYSLAFLALMYAVCDVMYRRRIFLKA
jgi:predicted acyltransferase